MDAMGESSKPVAARRRVKTKAAPRRRNLSRRDPESLEQDRRCRQGVPLPPGKWNATAQRLLDAARRLLAESGFNALSLEKIAREAGVNKPLIFYYFGNKAGLLQAVINSILQEDVETLQRMYATLPAGEARVHAVVDYCRKTVVDRTTNQMFFETAINMLRHAPGRARLADWCTTCCDLNAQGLLLASSHEHESAADIQALSVMTVALQDGLALQELIEPGARDTERIWALWEEFLGMVVQRAAP